MNTSSAFRFISVFSCGFFFFFWGGCGVVRNLFCVLFWFFFKEVDLGGKVYQVFLTQVSSPLNIVLLLWWSKSHFSRAARRKQQKTALIMTYLFQDNLQRSKNICLYASAHANQIPAPNSFLSPLEFSLTYNSRSKMFLGESWEGQPGTQLCGSSLHRMVTCSVPSFVQAREPSPNMHLASRCCAKTLCCPDAVCVGDC